MTGIVYSGVSATHLPFLQGHQNLSLFICNFSEIFQFADGAGARAINEINSGAHICVAPLSRAAL